MPGFVPRINMTGILNVIDKFQLLKPSKYLFLNGFRELALAPMSSSFRSRAMPAGTSLSVSRRYEMSLLDPVKYQFRAHMVVDARTHIC